MSTDALTVDAADGTRIHLDTSSGNPLSDSSLLAWRHAAVTGGLPEPTRRRWQQLRAGVVNMWEFDAAEYWSADGRAQFVGGNQQGKSSMMSMTTLTMLTGDLSPRYVDTFGDSHRTFRFYLEPTDDPKDRRPTDTQLNRGWTWVEYGRLTDAGAEYFTTLLFVQARRTSVDYPKKWVTHTGPERVRAGITLLHQNAVVPAADLPTLAGLTIHPNGKAYSKQVAGTLFGFTDPERLRTVVELLKTLRTPKLGTQLHPDWIIDRIRDSLPPLDAGEVNELAEGWDQLGQLAADRDAAKEAQEAVTAYVKSTWNPWADATLRLAADDLVAAVTVIDDVTRDERTARARAENARNECQQAQDAADATDATRAQLTERRETLLASQAYRDAADAGRQVSELTRTVDEIAAHLERSRSAQTVTHRDLGKARDAHRGTEAAVAAAEERAADQVRVTCRAANEAGLPGDTAAWAGAYDTARLETTMRERRVHVRETAKLDRAAARARSTAERDAQLLSAAEKAHRDRKTVADQAAVRFDDEAQRLSDSLERWSGTLTGAGTTPPTVADRERWLEDVFSQCAAPRPVPRLSDLVREEWTQPRVTPAEKAWVTAENDAAAARTIADAADAEADRIEQEPTPDPATPHLWQRRARPASGPAGAPLWELLDPSGDLSHTDLAGVEAAMAGAGLLDAWVTADGVWLPDRDGDDHVVALADPAPATTLRSVLSLAEPLRDGGPLAALATTTNRVLDAVGWVTDDGTSGDAGMTWVSASGAWSTPATSGRAAIPATGASLLGATARAQARARRVSALRAEANQGRKRAQELDAAARDHQAAAAHLRSLGAQAPGDADVLGAARDRGTARVELERAQTEMAARARAAERSEEAAAEADAALLTYATDKRLDPARLDAITDALDRAAASVTALASSAAEVRHARSTHQLRSEHLERADEAARAADKDVDGTAQRLTQARVAQRAARDALGATEQELLDEAELLAGKVSALGEEYKALHRKIVALSQEQGESATALSTVEEKRRAAEADRAARLGAWWVPVDAGLAAARGVEVEDDARTLTAALNQARALRSHTRPPRGWPETPGTGEREQVLARLRDRLSGSEFLKLNSTLNRTGGRSAVVEHDDVTGLPQVLVVVDASDARFSPSAAISALAAKSAQLGDLHDEQMHKVMEELLASTFVDHLREKVKQTETLLREVNVVLSQHPTGTTRTVLRLRRKQVGEHAGGYQVLNRLLEDSVDSPAVQQQVQAFLSGQIRVAQAEGQAEGRDWKELLGDKLDYRNWFAVVTEWRVLTSSKEGATQTWKELTREEHGKDSGGGKVMTMLQPLLATLATLYQSSATAPRPLWLDEAFDGVDAENTNSLLGMFVDFDFDFILAGPKSLVASRHVPCAAVWMVSRAPAPLPGVDLGLWLYGRGTQEKVPVGEQTWSEAAPGEDGPRGDDDVEPGRDEDVLWP